MIRPAHTDHRQQQRLRDIEEAVERHVDDVGPLLRAHPGQNGIVVQAGIVDQNLNGPGREHGFQRVPGFSRIGDVEAHRLRRAASFPDIHRDASRAPELAMRMHIDMMPRRREGAGDRAADRAAAAGHQRAAHTPPENRTVARPLSNSVPWTESTKR